MNRRRSGVALRVVVVGLKAAGEGWKAFKRILGTTTEPFFRMGMGERYYSYGAFFLGMYLWIGMSPSRHREESPHHSP
jgi:hypothetical protein